MRLLIAIPSNTTCERWKIEPVRFELDADGYGTVVYEINAPHGLFSFVLFSEPLSDDERNDRVIATKWDLTMALVEDRVDDAYLEKLRQNVPKQEAGRVDSRVFVFWRRYANSQCRPVSDGATEPVGCSHPHHPV